MRLNVVYQIITSNRWTLTVCRNNVFKIIYVLIMNFFPQIRSAQKDVKHVSFIVIWSHSKWSIKIQSIQCLISKCCRLVLCELLLIWTISNETIIHIYSFCFIVIAFFNIFVKSFVALVTSWSLRSSDVSIKVPGVATFHGLKLGVLFALRGCFAFLKTWEKMFCFESVLAMPWSTCLHFCTLLVEREVFVVG